MLWSIEADGRLIGLAAGDLWSMGNGFSLNQLVIAPDEWRKGYGFEAALALHRYFFDYLDLRRTAIDVRADNFLLTPDRVVLVDWPWASIGAAFAEMIFFAPSVGDLTAAGPLS